ncbi:MAG: LL-diaminopimelate aminotransferase [Rikenellaceae bacterium]
MILINSQFLKVEQDRIQAKIEQRVNVFSRVNPATNLIKLDSGDVVRPLASCVVEAMKRGAEEMGSADSFRGRGPIEGYDFLLDAIVKGDYKSRKIKIGRDEIFVNHGSKEDLAGIGDILCRDIRIAVVDPIYQTFVEANVVGNRAGDLSQSSGWSHLIYLKCDASNGFIPELPSVRPDVIYLSFPCDPTGCAMTRKELERWVKYAIANDALILFDATYESFITQDDVPHSIYEIKGARKVAIEFKSFSKCGGFTGLHCGYTVIPKDIEGYSFSSDRTASLNVLWRRRQEIKNYSPAYVIQRGAESLYTEEGQAFVRENVSYYMRNASMLLDVLSQTRLKHWGGVNSPYIWVESPYENSWKLFDKLLNECHIVSSPGERFGSYGGGYVRLSAFADHTKVIMASTRISDLDI